MKQRRTKIQIHRVRKNTSYTVQEICALLGVHKNTVREWCRNGLSKIDDKRPCLIHGQDLKAYLIERQKARKQKCAPTEFYCCRCRTPRQSLGNLADLARRNFKTLMVSGICETCETPLHKIQATKNLPKILKTFDIPKSQQEHIIATLDPSLNCDLGRSE